MAFVSVVIAAYNAARELPVAVGSALSQTGCDVEVIVVDDCSTDDTHAVATMLALDDRRLRVIKAARNGGPGAARNIGIAAARGDYVAPLDADDRFHPGRLARLVELACAHDAEMAADNLMLRFVGTGEAPAPMIPLEWIDEPQLISSTAFVVGNMGPESGPRIGYGYLKPIIRRDFLARHDVAYDESRFSEDYLLFLRCLLEGARWVVTPEPMYDYTIAGTSLTATHSAEDLLHLARAERALLDHPAARLNPGLAAAMRMHIDSVERAHAWFGFARALKARRPGAALARLFSRPSHFLHIGRQAWRTINRKRAAVAASRERSLV